MNANIQLALWIAHPVLELSLAGIMFWRRLHRTFPAFFAYIVFQVVNFLVLFPIYQWGSGPNATDRAITAYFDAYWISAAISVAIGFKVIHEIFLDMLRPYPNLKDLGTLLFKWAALVMLLVAMVVAVASQPSQQGADEPLVQAVIIMQRCVRFIQCGLILFLLFFSRHMGVSRRQLSFGIALGFGSFACVELVGLALVSGRLIHHPTVNVITTPAYTLVILIWIGYALLKATSRATSAMLMSQRWDQGLSELRHPAAGDSLIPMFESMVDRAFSRTPTESEGRESGEDKHIVHKMSVSHKTASSFSRRALTKDLAR
jgi:hypothetical protein